MAQVLGIIDLVFAKKQVDVEKGGKIKIGGYKQNGVTLTNHVDYAQEFEGSELTFTTTLKRGQSIFDLFPSGAQECQANCDTGQSYIWGDAFVTNRPEMTAGEGGKIEIKIMAGVPRELLNG